MTLRVASAAEAVARLEAWMPETVRDVVATLQRNGARAVLVGGGVRDAFLGREPPDWDLATDAEPADVARWFRRVVRTGEKHGTIMVLTDAEPVEVTTFRGEGPYLDGRRPSHVVFLKDLHADLARRDLTINAIAYDVVAHTLVDPFDGQGDLERRIIRCVGDARERFAEDGLRPLRAVRFVATLAFDVDPATAQALGSTIAAFEKVAWERKRVEMEKLLAKGVALARPLALLQDSGMLASLAPELTTPSAIDDILVLPGDAWLRFTAWAAQLSLPARTAADIATRWRASKNDAKRVEEALAAFAKLAPSQPPSDIALRLWLSESLWPAAHDAALIARVLHGGPYADFSTTLDALEAQKPAITIADLDIDGAALGSLGLKGRQVGDMLRALLAEVIKTPGQNKKNILIARAKSLSTASDPS